MTQTFKENHKESSLTFLVGEGGVSCHLVGGFGFGVYVTCVTCVVCGAVCVFVSLFVLYVVCVVYVVGGLKT